MSHHHHCSNGHCSDHGHHHHHHGSCSDHEESCEEHQCCCGHHHHGVVDKDFAHQLLEMADEAWMEILKDKIKQKILESNGPHLDQLAKLVSEFNKERWKHKMAGNSVAQDYREKFDEFFHQK